MNIFSKTIKKCFSSFDSVSSDRLSENNEVSIKSLITNLQTFIKFFLSNIKFSVSN